MKRFLAFLCVLAMALGVVNPAVFAAEISDVQAVIDAGTEEIIVLEADAFNITIDRDTTIDLNGHSIDGVTVLAGTLYLLDSQTADYTVADGIYGHVTNVTGSVKAAPGYLQVGDSFHAVNLDIYAMTLRAADVGVYYKSRFAADEVVAAQVESFGVALSVVTAPSAENLETYCGYSQFTGFEAGEGANSASSSTLLKNIMKAANDDEKNAKNAAMPVYGRAYIKTSEGYVFGETVKRSLQEQVEAIDGVWETLSDAQKTPVLSMLESYTAVMENWEIPNIQGIQIPGEDAEIEIPIEVTAENGIVTEAVTVEQDEISITVPAGTKLAEGVSQLTLTITPKETSEAGLTLEKSEVLMPMDVHVDGLAADNAQPLTIYLGKVMAENLNMGNYTVYHVENGKANEMVLIPVGAEFTAHNQYKYTLDGELTLYMASFSEVAVVSDVNNAWEGNRDYTWYNTTDKVLYIRNADQLAAFSAIVGDMAFKEVEVQVGNYTLIDTEPIVEEDSFAGKTVVLLADIDLGDKDDASEHIFYPIGYGNANMSYVKPSDGTATGTYMQAFEGTFDGNGNTISNFYQNTWQMWGNYDGNSYNSAMGLFAYINGGTVKNLTVDNFSSDGEFAATGVIAAYAANAAFENIAITNCNPRVYNTGNGGIVGIGGLSTDSEKAQMTFQNITIDNTNKITALWGSWDVACGGLIGMFRGAGHVYMDNCHVAAQIDVYNDVCGNYQYYWYRYAGMLIGTNKTMVTDANGYTVPETTKFHAEGCTVHFGTWNDYYYCELVENSLASYTHDHQFSRLTLIDSLAEIQDEAGNWNKTGNFMIVSENKCYHVRKDENGFYLHSHDDYNRDGTDDYETVNGESILVENNRCVYLPFNQLFTGYGWGVKHIPLGEFDGVIILPRETADSVVKFEGLVENGTTYATGSSFEIGNLFAAIEQNDAAIVGENVQVTVSPADDKSNVSGTYVANTDDWTKGTLKLSGTGAAVITITDYYFCQATTITVNVQSTVAKIGEVEYTSLQDAMDAVENGGRVDLQASVTIQDYLDIYTANNGEVERAITLNLNGHTIAPAADYKYEWYPLVFVGINQSLTIENGTIVSDEHTAIGVYGSLKLEGVVIERTVTADAEESVCIWNWGEDDDYYQDCQYLLTGSATISGGSIEGGVLVEGPVELKPGTEIDKLYLNTKTGRGKFILPDGYGLVKKNGYYTNLHEHEYENGVCATCGFASSYVKTDLANIDSTDVVVITVTTEGGTVYAMSNDKKASDAPTAVVITVKDNAITSDVADNIQWNISNGADGMTIYPNGITSTWLYCTNGNDGVRVGVGTAKHFVIDAETGYLKITETEEPRYLGVFDSKEWRCYRLDDGKIQSNIQGQTLAFYVLKTNCEHKNVEDRGEIAPTCTAAGHEAGVYCLDCDTYISGGELMDAVAHTEGKFISSTEPTCTEDGKYVYRCGVCNKKVTETTEKLGHTWNEATCSAPKTCAICGTTEGETVDHVYENGKCKWCGAAEPVEPEQPVVTGSFVLTDLANIKTGDIVVITMTKSGKVYAMTDNNGTSNPPVPFAVTISDGKITGEVADNIQWVIEKNGESLTFYKDDSKAAWLYCTATNNGVRVGTNANKVFTVDAATKYLKHTGTSRYVGIYNTQDWRCYTSTSTNISSQTLAFYVWTIDCTHEYVSVETAPTCTEAGYITKTCSKCNEVKVEAGEAAKGHTEVVDKAVAATCKDTGLTEGKHCSVCQAVLVKQETVPVTNQHTYQNGTCSVCGEQEQTGYELTFMVNGKKEATYIATTTFSGWPGASTIPAGYTFAGWVENTVAETTAHSQTVYNADKAYTVTGDKTFYALFTRTEESEEIAYFEKVTSSATDWTGEYLIVYEAGKVAFNGALTTLDATKNTVSVSISSNRITANSELEKAAFSIAKSGSYYQIKSNGGYYIGQTSNANGLKAQASALNNTITFNNGNVNIVSGGAYLRFNAASDQWRFRYYKSSSYTGQKAICLYKYVPASVTATTYYTTTVN